MNECVVRGTCTRGTRVYMTSSDVVRVARVHSMYMYHVARGSTCILCTLYPVHVLCLWKKIIHIRLYVILYDRRSKVQVLHDWLHDRLHDHVAEQQHYLRLGNFLRFGTGVGPDFASASEYRVMSVTLLLNLRLLSTNCGWTAIVSKHHDCCDVVPNLFLM